MNDNEYFCQRMLFDKKFFQDSKDKVDLFFFNCFLGSMSYGGKYNLSKQLVKKTFLINILVNSFCLYLFQLSPFKISRP